MVNDKRNVYTTEAYKCEFHYPDLYMFDSNGNDIYIPGRWHQKNQLRSRVKSIARIFIKIDIEISIKQQKS